mmetsp:Transcript_14912/g.44362  ORF Transcript_14912/g.44362 Transcript_14912/m.44362 type:complete len:244 (-) Transcript_14912:83-814(-)
MNMLIKLNAVNRGPWRRARGGDAPHSLAHSLTGSRSGLPHAQCRVCAAARNPCALTGRSRPAIGRQDRPARLPLSVRRVPEAGRKAPASSLAALAALAGGGERLLQRAALDDHPVVEADERHLVVRHLPRAVPLVDGDREAVRREPLVHAREHDLRAVAVRVQAQVRARDTHHVHAVQRHDGVLRLLPGGPLLPHLERRPHGARVLHLDAGLVWAVGPRVPRLAAVMADDRTFPCPHVGGADV